MLSISIVTYKTNIETIARLIDSLKAAIAALPTNYTIDKISLIENRSISLSTRKALHGLLATLDQSELIVTGRNLGYGIAHNIAINKSNSDYHLILNPDVILGINSLMVGLEYLEMNNNVVALSPEVCDEKGVIQNTTKTYPSLFDLLLRGLDSYKLNRKYNERLSRYENRHIHARGEISDVLLISGCFMLCRTAALQSLKGFDRRYFLYFEDYSLSLELRKFGDIRYLPSLKIMHSGGMASKKGLKHIIYFISSACKFFTQYGWKLR